MAKVSVIGAGNVGATCANAMLHMKFCSEIVLLDIKEGVSEGKAMDMMQTANLYKFDTKVTGVTNDYKATANSDVVVVTSGGVVVSSPCSLERKSFPTIDHRIIAPNMITAAATETAPERKPVIRIFSTDSALGIIFASTMYLSSI